jgi:hypothetical protein
LSRYILALLLRDLLAHLLRLAVTLLLWNYRGYWLLDLMAFRYRHRTANRSKVTAIKNASSSI